MNKMRHLLTLGLAAFSLTGCLNLGLADSADENLVNRPSCEDEDVAIELLSTCIPDENWTSTEIVHKYAGVEALATDSKGNIYVGGIDYFALTSNLSVIYKYDRYGKYITTIAFGGGANAFGNGAGIRFLAVDSQDNLFAVGYAAALTDMMVLMNDTCASGQAFVAKINSNAELVWVKGSNNCGDAVNVTGFAVGPNDHLYLTGVAAHTLENTTPLRVGPDSRISDAFLRVLDNDGNRISAVRFETSMWDEPNRIAFDGAGNVFVAGVTQTDFYFFTQAQYATKKVMALNKFAADGSHLWGRQLTGPIRDDSTVILDVNAGRVAVIGSTTGFFDGAGLASWGSTDLAIAVFDSDTGNKLWSKQVATGFPSWGADVKLDETGKMHLAGRTIQMRDPNNTNYAENQDWRGHLWEISPTGDLVERHDLQTDGSHYLTRMSVMPDGAFIMHMYDVDQYFNELFRVAL